MFRFLFCLLLLSSTVIPQQNETIVTIGNSVINQNEFRLRYEMMPHLSKMQFNDDSSKYHFLYSLIAEKLWALEAVDKGYHLNETIVSSLKPLEKMYIRDALFRQEIEKYLTVKESEIQDAVRKYSVTLKVLVFATVDSQKAFQLYNEVRNGGDPLRIISSKYPGDFEQNIINVDFGQFEDIEIEDALFSLPADSISVPFRTRFGWFIFKVSDREKRITGTSAPNERAVVKDILRQRKARDAGSKYLADLLKDITIQTDSTLFFILADELSDVISEKAATLDSIPAEGIYIYEPEITKVINLLDEKDLNGILIHFEKDPVSIKEFLYDLIVTGFSTSSADKRIVTARLNNAVRFFVEQELIAREGYRLGLHNSEEVVNSISKWRDNFLAQMMRNSFLDSVRITRDDVYNYYMQKQNKPEMKTKIKIAEVLTEGLDAAEVVLNELNNGRDIRELAELYSVRESTRDSRGEHEWLSADELGEIGRIASSMQKGEVYGPLKVAEGFSIFQLLDKKQEEEIFNHSFEEIYDQLKNELTAKKLYHSYMHHTAKLALKHGLEIDHTALKNIKVSNISMFTYKHMGFGGRITAYPLTSPFYEWIYDYYTLKKQMP